VKQAGTEGYGKEGLANKEKLRMVGKTGERGLKI
jgi:hypothetical protein